MQLIKELQSRRQYLNRAQELKKEKEFQFTKLENDVSDAVIEL